MITNKGPRAARNCKGILVKEEVKGKEEMKVCWSIPSERYRMTINAHSMEYLDLCGVLEGKRSQILMDLKYNISKLKEYLDTEGSKTLGEIHRQALKMKIDREYGVDGNKLMQNMPSIIAPTENGWQFPPWHNYILLHQFEVDSKQESTFRIAITAENARRIDEPVTISTEIPDKSGKIISFPTNNQSC